MEEHNIENVEQNNIEEQYVAPLLLSEFTGYDHLYYMCKEVRNDSHSAKGYINPITPRLSYIISALAIHGINFEFVPLHYLNQSVLDSDDNKLANVVVTFKGTDETLPTIIFSAHHDIANPDSENCQDNTASVCNLIHLCHLLKQQEEQIAQTVVIAFTDCEEIGGRGMNKLISEIQEGKYGTVGSMFALELTANGNHIWASGTKEHSELHDIIEEGFNTELHFVQTPYNESVNARSVGLPACCIGSLADTEITNALSRGYCNTWALCHSERDTFEKSAVKEDMDNFVHGMFNMIIK